MDDIMILMNKMIIDVQGFDETQFGIFDAGDIPQLLFLWEDMCNKDMNAFIRALSPLQKHQLTLWATSRTSYSVKDLIKALQKFTKHLKSSSYSKHKIYPKKKTKL